MDIQPYIGPVIVTALYIGVYYAFQILVLRVKNRLGAEYAARGEKFDRYHGGDREMLAADRAQLNMLEHMPPFLALLWLHAVFVSPLGATIAGGIYTASRAIYPIAMGPRVGRGVRAAIMASTGPGYLVLAYLLGGLLWEMAA